MQSFFVFGGGGTLSLKANFLCVGLGGFIDLGEFLRGITNFPFLNPPVYALN